MRATPPRHVSFIGSSGIPNRYGGFEAFLEQCAPEMARQVDVTVTCEERLYEDRAPLFNGVHRVFMRIPANGKWSPIHDLAAFWKVFGRSTHIVVFGLAAAPWYPLFRAACAVTGKRLLVNIDGAEWRRAKFSPMVRATLRVFGAIVQFGAHAVIYDNAALRECVLPPFRSKAFEIAYAGDHVKRIPGTDRVRGTALTICRVEPENNIELLLRGALASSLERYTIVGNWNSSEYGRTLRERWSTEPRLDLRDPIYDPQRLAELRERCEWYLHGHSVGGTNPSLVEMLYYDCGIAAFDCTYNRSTAGDAAAYFTTSDSLAALIDTQPAVSAAARERVRARYTRALISGEYLRVMGCTG